MTGTNVVAFFTDGGDPATGLSPTVRIRDLADSSLVVTDAAMTEVGDGFYTYYFATYLDTKDYTIRGDGGATLNGSERYTSASNELGDTNDAISNIKQGGGMVVQYPANIINKEDIKFRKELKKLLMIIQSKVDIVVDVQGKDLNLDEVNTRIDASMADILKMISGNSEDQKDSMD